MPLFCFYNPLSSNAEASGTGTVLWNSISDTCHPDPPGSLLADQRRAQDLPRQGTSRKLIWINQMK